MDRVALLLVPCADDMLAPAVLASRAPSRCEQPCCYGQELSVAATCYPWQKEVGLFSLSHPRLPCPLLDFTLLTLHRPPEAPKLQGRGVKMPCVAAPVPPIVDPCWPFVTICRWGSAPPESGMRVMSGCVCHNGGPVPASRSRRYSSRVVTEFHGV
jgi:hypothetical protein